MPRGSNLVESYHLHLSTDVLQGTNSSPALVDACLAAESQTYTFGISRYVHQFVICKG